MREDVLNALTEMLVTALQRDPIVKQSQVVGAQIVDHILRDPQVYFEARKVLSDTLRDSELQVAAKESIWNIIVPWGAKSRLSEEEKGKQHAIQVVNEIVASVKDMTPEEKEALFSLQARLRTELASGVSRHSSSSNPGQTQTAQSNPPPSADNAAGGTAAEASRTTTSAELASSSPPSSPTNTTEEVPPVIEPGTASQAAADTSAGSTSSS
mmetsp:Transcript_30603/g.55902  ORF Transcript_30603/g.55902 Transcript_30603/m.55902 type:complete len:212 (-) Transcript_30603:16-651(-)